MKSYRLMNPKSSVAIVTMSVLIAISLVGCNADATNSTAANSVTSTDDESDEEPKDTVGVGHSPDRDDFNSEANGIAEEIEKENRRREDDRPPSVLEIMEEESIDIETALVDQINEIDVDDFDTDIIDDSTEEPNGDTRCPPRTRCGSSVSDKDGTSTSAADTNPTIYFGEPEIDGPIKRGDLEAGLRRFERQFDACVQTIAPPEKRTGQLTLEWTIELRGHREPSARATNPEVKESTFEDEAFHQCLTTVLKGARFPHDGSQKSDIQYPLGFRIDNASAEE